ncbi:nucleolar protein 12 [Ischnura elegans]|uniref:nucleolar protein 12 n=1 Tax=Ischnura elegans TaxID=197161 RepID=UPI001ED8BA09|nr:nucleolar protein 12 [Ischnura elegans]
MAKSRSKSRSTRNVNRKTKVHLVFDPAARREFLTGFHSRKMQRKKKAQEEFQKQLKEEKKRLKQEAKKAYADMISSHQPNVSPVKPFSEEINLESHCVSISEISTADIKMKNHWIGENQVEYDEKNEAESENPTEDGSNQKVQKLEGNVKKILKKKATLNAKQSKTLQKQMHLQNKKNIKDTRRKNRLKAKVMKNKKKK